MIEEMITAPDGHEIQLYVWPNPQANAWIHINHGMAEHAQRYDDFAQQLVNAGFAVVAHNHRGHGTSPTTVIGSYGEDNSWAKVLSDLETVRDHACSTELPYYIFAHSMGSFIAQSYLSSCTREIDGLILSGSNLQAPFLPKAGQWVAKIEKMRLGEKNSSKLLQFLSFGTFNQSFKPNRTEYDWLSSVNDQVDLYINDPLCGFACSTGLWNEFLGALTKLFSKDGLKNIQKNLPIFILGGDKDPVGLMGKGLPKLAQAYEKNGQDLVTLKLYPNARHEILNEVNALEVSADIISWLKSQQKAVAA